MGVKFGPLFKEAGVGLTVDPSYLDGKTIAIDALPTIYEVLATIRDYRGEYLKDNLGRVTSHLVGLFNRTARMLSLGIKPVYVFDGPPHPLKNKTVETRKERKEQALQKLNEARKAGVIEDIVKYAKQAIFVTDEIIDDAKKLLKLLGVPIVQAPHDGEAQAAYLVKRGVCFAVASPDYDSFLYGSPKVIRGLKMSLQRKEKPIIYDLSTILRSLNITREQLVDIAILIGTDFNPEGFRGIGPKKALNFIKKHGSIENLIKKKIISWELSIDVNELREVFLNPKDSDDYVIKFSEPEEEKIIEFLVEEHNFSLERVKKELGEIFRRIKREKKGGVQASLDKFFG